MSVSDFTNSPLRDDAADFGNFSCRSRAIDIARVKAAGSGSGMQVRMTLLRE
jgi:hypothetical protein